MTVSLSAIAQQLGAELKGSDAQVSAMATLAEACGGDLSLCLDRRHLSALRQTRAAAVLIPAARASWAEEAPGSVLLVKEPRLAMAQTLAILYPPALIKPGVCPGALVDASAEVHAQARIEPGACVGPGTIVGAGTLVESGVVLGPEVVVGAACRLGANCVVRKGCRLGDRVHLASGVVIGARGFGVAVGPDGPLSIPQVGTVVIEDDVEIGANSTVDRATLGVTRIGRGSKIDNLVQVGHNVQIGKHVLIAAQVGLAGSVEIGDAVVMGGQAGVADHVKVGARAQIGGKAGVTSAVAAGERVAGFPAIPVRQWLRQQWRLRKPAKHKTASNQGEKK